METGKTSYFLKLLPDVSLVPTVGPAQVASKYAEEFGPIERGLIKGTI